MKKTSFKFFFLLLAMLSGALWVYLLYGVYTKQNSIITTTTDLSNLEAEGTKLVSLRNLAEDVSSNVSKLNDAFVKRGDAATFVEELEHVADLSGVKVSVSDLSIDEKKEGPIKQLRIRADVNGTEGTVVKYLENLESMRRLIVVNQVSMTKYEGEKHEPLSRASFDLTAYVID